MSIFSYITSFTSFVNLISLRDHRQKDKFSNLISHTLPSCKSLMVLNAAQSIIVHINQMLVVILIYKCSFQR